MRPILHLATAFALILLAACEMRAPEGSAAPADVAPMATDAISVTPLADAPGSAAPVKPVTPVLSTQAKGGAVGAAPPPVQMADKTTPRPKPRPADLTKSAPVVAKDVAPPPPPPPPASPEEARCRKTGGDWSAVAGSSGHLCVHRTRDSGKSCQRKSDCQGQCLAQSGTCSPIMPLMGCNDVLQSDGSRMTLCLQ